MWQNSSELLDYALQELQVAVENGKQEVEIVLKEFFAGDVNEMRKFCDRLEIKTITEILREEFSNYDIKSIIRQKENFKAIITYRKGPCDIFYTLVWKLTLRKKEN